MTTIGEELVDGVRTCICCNSNNVCVESTSYYYIERNKDKDITKEYDSDGDHDEKYTCADCGEELRFN